MLNHALRHITNPKDAIVLTLADEQNCDLAVLQEKGFNARNVFAVSRDAAVVFALRGRGELAVVGELSDVVSAWSDAFPVSLLIADFTGGFCRKNLSVFVAAGKNKAFWKCCIIANFLRGRDELRCDEQTRPEFKHRGYSTLTLLQVWAAPVICAGWRAHRETELGKEAVRRFGEDAAARVYAKSVAEVFDPQFGSYRSNSGAQYFDSLFLAVPFPTHHLPREVAPLPNRMQRMRRQLAAIRATRTRSL